MKKALPIIFATTVGLLAVGIPAYQTHEEKWCKAYYNKCYEKNQWEYRAKDCDSCYKTNEQTINQHMKWCNLLKKR